MTRKKILDALVGAALLGGMLALLISSDGPNCSESRYSYEECMDRVAEGPGRPW